MARSSNVAGHGPGSHWGQPMSPSILRGGQNLPTRRCPLNRGSTKRLPPRAALHPFSPSKIKSAACAFSPSLAGSGGMDQRICTDRNRPVGLCVGTNTPLGTAAAGTGGGGMPSPYPHPLRSHKHSAMVTPPPSP